MEELIKSKEGHLFRVYYFVQCLTPVNFTLFEDYYLIRNGEVLDNDYYKTKDDPLQICLRGEDLGVFDGNMPERRTYDVNVNELGKK